MWQRKIHGDVKRLGFKAIFLAMRRNSSAKYQSRVGAEWKHTGDSWRFFLSAICFSVMVIRGGNHRRFTKSLFYGRRCEIAMCDLVSFRIFGLGSIRVSPSRTRKFPLSWLWYIVTTKVRRVSASARLSSSTASAQPLVTHRVLSESMELLKHR